MRWILAAVLGTAALFGAHAGAGTFTAASPPGSTVLDLDTQDGNYSIWRLEAADGIDAIHTTVQVHRLGNDPRWTPTFTITLRNGDAGVLLHMSSRTRQPPLTLESEVTKAGKETSGETYIVTLPLDQKMDIKIEWTPDGTVAFWAGGEKHTVALGAPVKTVEFSGSTGEVEYNPLEIGHTGP
jgi:hypothetical protein